MRYRDAYEKVLAIAYDNLCRHESTHRGGVLWTICDDCGQQWADDRGGFKPNEQLLELERIEELVAAAHPVKKAKTCG